MHEKIFAAISKPCFIARIGTLPCDKFNFTYRRCNIIEHTDWFNIHPVTRSIHKSANLEVAIWQ